MSFAGKGIYLWELESLRAPEEYVEDGENASDMRAVARWLRGTGYASVFISLRRTDWRNPRYKARAKQLTRLLRRYGVLVWGWRYTYPSDKSDGGIKRTVDAFVGLGADGYIINAEKEFIWDRPPPDNRTADQILSETEQLVNGLRRSIRNRPIVLSSFRSPDSHPKYPWEKLLQICDYNLPQAYWEENFNPREQIKSSLQKFLIPPLPRDRPIPEEKREPFPRRPPFPTGSSYTDRLLSWIPSGDDLALYDGMAKDILLGANYYIAHRVSSGWSDKVRGADELPHHAFGHFTRSRTELHSERQRLDVLRRGDGGRLNWDWREGQWVGSDLYISEGRSIGRCPGTFDCLERRVVTASGAHHLEWLGPVPGTGTEVRFIVWDTGTAGEMPDHVWREGDGNDIEFPVVVRGQPGWNRMRLPMRRPENTWENDQWKGGVLSFIGVFSFNLRGEPARDGDPDNRRRIRIEPGDFFIDHLPKLFDHYYLFLPRIGFGDVERITADDPVITLDEQLPGAQDGWTNGRIELSRATGQGAVWRTIAAAVGRVVTLDQPLSAAEVTDIVRYRAFPGSSAPTSFWRRVGPSSSGPVHYIDLQFSATEVRGQPGDWRDGMMLFRNGTAHNGTRRILKVEELSSTGSNVTWRFHWIRQKQRGGYDTVELWQAAETGTINDFAAESRSHARLTLTVDSSFDWRDGFVIFSGHITSTERILGNTEDVIRFERNLNFCREFARVQLSRSLLERVDKLRWTPVQSNIGEAEGGARREPDQSEAAVVGAPDDAVETGDLVLLGDPDGFLMRFEEEAESTDNRYLNAEARSRLWDLAFLAGRQWPGLKLVVKTAWLGPTDFSSHREGRAVRFALDDEDGSKLGRLARLARQVGFNWVQVLPEDTELPPVSVRAVVPRSHSYWCRDRTHEFNKISMAGNADGEQCELSTEADAESWLWEDFWGRQVPDSERGGLLGEALNFWNGFLQLERSEAKIPEGYLQRFNRLLRALCWAESGYGSAAPGAMRTGQDPLQIGRYNGALWGSLLARGSPPETVQRGSDSTNIGATSYLSNELPAVAQLRNLTDDPPNPSKTDLPDSAHLVLLRNPYDGHFDPSFNRVMSFYWGALMLIQRVNAWPNVRSREWKTFDCGGCGWARLIGGAFLYRGIQRGAAADAGFRRALLQNLYEFQSLGPCLMAEHRPTPFANELSRPEGTYAGAYYVERGSGRGVRPAAPRGAVGGAGLGIAGSMYGGRLVGDPDADEPHGGIYLAATPGSGVFAVVGGLLSVDENGRLTIGFTYKTSEGSFGDWLLVYEDLDTDVRPGPSIEIQPGERIGTVAAKGRLFLALERPEATAEQLDTIDPAWAFGWDIYVPASIHEVPEGLLGGTLETAGGVTPNRSGDGVYPQEQSR